MHADTKMLNLNRKKDNLLYRLSSRSGTFSSSGGARLLNHRSLGDEYASDPVSGIVVIRRWSASLGSSLNLSQPLAIQIHEGESASEFSEIVLDPNVDGSTYAPKCAGSKCAPKSRSGSVRTIIGDAARDLRHREPRPATTSSPRSRSRALRRLSAKSMTSANLHPGSSPPTSGSLSRDSIHYDGLLYSTMNRD